MRNRIQNLLLNNGYVVIKNIFAHKQKELFNIWMNDILSIAQSNYKNNFNIKYYDNDKISSIQNISKSYGDLDNFINKDLKFILENIDTTKEYNLHLDSLNFLNSDYKINPHIDNEDCYMKVIIPLCDSNNHNGCIHIAENALYVNDRDFKFDDYIWRPIHLYRGDILLYKPFVPIKRNTNYSIYKNIYFSFYFK